MKTFDQIVDKCFKPRKPDGLYLLHRAISDIEAFAKGKSIIYGLYEYSECLSKLYYGKEINEPVIKICKRILNKPNRFHLVTTKTGTSEDCNNGVWVKRAYTYSFILKDKDTNQQFIIEHNTLKFPTCLTDDENRLLAATLREWYANRKDIECEKKLKLEQKRKDKFRQELTDLYKDL